MSESEMLEISYAELDELIKRGEQGELSDLMLGLVKEVKRLRLLCEDYYQRQDRDELFLNDLGLAVGRAENLYRSWSGLPPMDRRV